jgi:NTE family protein
VDDTHSDKTTAPIGGAAPSGPALVEAIGAIRVFAGMAERDLEQLARIGQLVSVPRGQALLRAGDLADHLYFVVDGRFAILAGHERARVGEIGRGEPVGEIAFFRGGRRTADVIALRHSLVLAFARAQLDELVRSVPHFAQTILHSLASRLASATPFIAEHVRHCAPLSIAIAPAGQGVIPPSFVSDLQRTLERECGSRVFSSEFLRAMFGEWQTFSANDVVTFVEAAEQQGVCLFDCSDLPSYVAQNILAACDALLFAGSFDSDPQPNALERFAMQECAGAHMRLALVHDKAAAVYPGTARWLADRIGGAQETGHQFAMHHHVAVDDPASLARLARFITGPGHRLCRQRRRRSLCGADRRLSRLSRKRRDVRLSRGNIRGRCHGGGLRP